MPFDADVLIIGGGFSGTALAANLVNLGGSERVVIVDPADAGDFGPAYRTNCPLHLLNAPARAMSALTEDPEGFVRWASDHGYRCEPGSFVERSVYRQYLGSVWKSTFASGLVHHEKELAIALTPNVKGWTCTLASGRKLLARRVVIAFGVGRAQTLGALAGITTHPRYITALWDAPVLRLPKRLNRVAVLGSGLTAVDGVLAVESEGHAPSYVLVSRHGLLPRVHQAPSLLPENLPKQNASIAVLVREVRALIRSNGQWRAVLDAMRPHLPEYWKALSDESRWRFLRHIRPYWETHRHRMALQVSDRLEEISRQGRLEVIADRVWSVSSKVESLVVECSSGGSLEVDLFINCSGPPPVSSWDSALIRQLVADQYARIDSFDLGVECDDDGRVSGAHAEGLYVLGILQKGQLWETTAVRELAAQAARLARALAR